MSMPTINTKTFAFDTNPQPDSSRYTGPAHTAQLLDTIQVYRTAPKKTKSSEGVARSAHKRSKTVLVNGVPLTGIVQTSYSQPVGFPDSEMDTLRADSAAFATSTAGASLVQKATITY